MEIVFETLRLIARKFQQQDFNLILKLNSDPIVLKYLHEKLLETGEQAKTILNTIILPQYKKNLGRWALHTKNNNQFIGWCGLKYLIDTNEIDIGYRLLQSAWGQGFATEAASQTLFYGFNNLNLPRITGRAHVENIASIKVLEKIGMQFIKEEIVDEVPVKTYTADKSNH